MKLDLNLSLTDSAAATTDWVKKSRILERTKQKNEKLLAEERLRKQQEEEEELVKQTKDGYSASDLRGMKVLHSDKDFEAGETVILTLADASVLEKDEDGKILGLNEEGDMLENVNLADNERRLERERQLKRLRQPIYSALDDFEFQEGVVPGTKAPILSHYDKEKKRSARMEIGDEGLVNNLDNGVANDQLSASKKVLDSLLFEKKDMAEFYTTAEYAKFNKGKKNSKKRKLRKREDDDEEEEANEVIDAAHPNEEVNNVNDDGSEKPSATAISTDGVSMEVEDSKFILPKLEKRKRMLANVVFEEDDPAMVAALAKARKLAMQQRKNVDENESTVTGNISDKGAEFARRIVSNRMASQMDVAEAKNDEEEIDAEGRRPDGKLVFNSTTEFSTMLQARLGEKARSKAEVAMKDLENSVQNAKSNAAASLKKKAEATESDDVDIGDITENPEMVDAWDEAMVGMEEDEESDDDDDDDEEDPLQFLHAQPSLAKGMASTLALLKDRGELRKSEQLAGRAKDSRNEDPSTDFGVKIEYRDSNGRKLTQKEAFRQLSYRFHGYGPGKKKLEKRMKVGYMDFLNLCTMYLKVFPLHFKL